MNILQHLQSGRSYVHRRPAVNLIIPNWSAANLHDTISKYSCCDQKDIWGTKHASNALQQRMHNKQTCRTAHVKNIPLTHPQCHHKTGTDKNTKGPSAKRAIYRKGRMSQVSGVSLPAHLPCARVWPCLRYRAGLWQALFVTSTAPEANQRSLTRMALSYSYTVHKCSATEGALAPVKTNMPSTHVRWVKPEEISVKPHNEFIYEISKPAHKISPLYPSQMLGLALSVHSVLHKQLW